MTASNSLSLTEELLLLSLDDEKGKLVAFDSTVLRFTLAGATLFELILLGKIKINADKIVAWPTELVGDPILDMAIERLGKKNKVRTIEFWINQLSKDYIKVKHILLEKLVTIGAIKQEEHSFLWAFKYNRYPTDNSRIEDRVRLRVRNRLFGEEEIDTRDYVLLCLISASKLEGEVFGKEDVAEARDRIAVIKGDNAIGNAIIKAIIDFEAALTIAITTTAFLPTITT